MRFGEILKEDYKTAYKKYIDSGNLPDEVKNILQKFRNLQPKITDQNERNIDWWAKYRNFEQLKQYLDNIEDMPSKKQMKKSRTGNAHIIFENSEWLIIIPLDKDASCFHGKTTDWCTTKPFEGHFEEYFYMSNVVLIYLIQKQTGERWAIAHDVNYNDSFFDKNDTKISAEAFELETGINPYAVIAQIKNTDVENKIISSRTQYKELHEKTTQAIKKLPKDTTVNAKIEKALITLKDSDLIYEYFYKVGVSDKFSGALQIVAVKMIPRLIEYIKNPTENIQKAAVRKHPSVIEYITNPTQEVINIVIENDPSSGALIFKKIVNRFGIDNIPERSLKIALNNNPNAIKHIPDPMRELQLIAVKNSPILYTHEKITYKEDIEIQKAAVQFGIYSDDNLKYILENDILADDSVIRYAIESNNRYNKHNLNGIVVILFNFDLHKKFETEIKNAYAKETDEQ